MGTKQEFVKKGIKRISQIPAQAVVDVLRFYHRRISPFLGPVCRFYPSCSVYAVEVITSFGLCKGGWLACKRLVKCNPLHPGGVDLPPSPPSDPFS
jgi:uncharacterized protein